jgi:hypothetical protein
MAGKRTPKGGGTYLYAVMADAAEVKTGLKGLFDSSVYVVEDGELSAMVSDLPEIYKLRPERRHLAAHQNVLKEAVEMSKVVLPVSFGNVADSAGSIKKLLTKNRKDLLGEIGRIEGKVEMELCLFWEVTNVFEYFIAIHPKLKKARDQVYDGTHKPARDEEIGLGQLFERIINEEREKLTARVEKNLCPVCAEIRRNKCRNEREAARLACLIGKDDVRRFEIAVNEVAGLFDDNYAFEYSGEFPPFNFIDVRLKL